MQKARQTLLAGIFLILVLTPIWGTAQNVVVNSSFEDDSGWTVYNGGTPNDIVEYTFPYTADKPTLGSGNACLHFYGEIVSGSSWINGLIWQPVTLQGGKTYILDAAWKYLDGNVDAGSWFQIYVSQEEPVDGQDWTPIGSSHSDRMYGFNSWSGCSGLDIDGMFMDEACDPNHNALYRAPAAPGEQVEVYLGLKTGAGWGGTYFEILVDDITFRENKVLNGDFEDAADWSVTGGAAADKLDVVLSQSGNNGPALGKGKFLSIKGAANTGNCEGVIWQPVKLIGGAEYGFNAGFRHISGDLTAGFYCIVYVAPEAPVEGQEWKPSVTPVAFFNSAAGCSGNGANGTFRRDGCGGFGRFTAFGAPGQEVTAYLGFKTGCSKAVAAFEVTIDDVSLVLLSETSAQVVEQKEQTPIECILEQNYPNPFNPYTDIKFTLPKTSNARLAVYDLSGRTVSILLDGTVEAGSHTVSFSGEGLSTGIYLYALEVEGQKITRRMVLLK
ncbi:MAG: T9SS type A sorting domain-containing protein [candidate division KSB1 bacterium]|nr:T9SS type A sorting domain-containing protein [candidate division KSB1 bacterium]